MQIAALAHDIERGIYTDKDKIIKEKFDDYDKRKREHSRRSAKIICDLLRKHRFNKDFIKKVEYLVLLYEFGGDEEVDVLRDADSISFFEDNLEYYFDTHGGKTAGLKIEFMYNRMSKKAKDIVEKFKYENKELNSIFHNIVS